MSELLFTGINLNELLDRIGQIVDSKLSEFTIQKPQKNQSNFISRKEVSSLLKVSLPTLHEYTKYGWLQSYKIGKRVLYKYEEVLACLDKVATNKHKKGGYHGA